MIMMRVVASGGIAQALSGWVFGIGLREIPRSFTKVNPTHTWDGVEGLQP